MFSLFSFSIKNAFRKKGIALLAMFGVAVGISLMVFILASSEGMNKVFSESFSKAAAQITVSSSTAPMGFGITGGNSSLIPKNYAERIEKIENVKSVSPRVMGIFSSESLKTADPISLIVGIDPKKEKEESNPVFSITEGRSFSKENEIIVGKMFIQSANMVGEKEVKIGDMIEIIIPPESPKEPPKTENFEIVGKFETGNMMEDSYIFSSEKTVRKISKIPEDKVNSIIVEVDSIDNVEEVDEKIQKEFEGAGIPIQTMLNKDIFSSLESTLDDFAKFKMLISVFAGIAGGMCILIVMLISVIERKKEFGILKAVGWSGKNITLSILIESLILSLIGVILGILLGWLAIIMSGYYMEIFKDFLFLNWKVATMVLVFGTFLGVIGGIYPAWKASRVAPIEILRGT